MVINKDQSNAHSVRLAFDSGSGTAQGFSGTVTMVTFGSDQYVWRSDGANSHADPENPPVSAKISGGPGTVFSVPRSSVTVLRGKIGIAQSEKR